MLYYSGYTHRIGGNVNFISILSEPCLLHLYFAYTFPFSLTVCSLFLCLTNCSDVDEGSTVTDFLPAERARGITIQSAAITFHWPPSQDPSNIKPNITSSGIPSASGSSAIAPRSALS